MAKNAKKETTKKDKPVDLIIEWNIPDNIRTGYATNIVVQKIDNEFRVMYFELKQDILLRDEDREEMLERGSVRADCIANLIITADRMPKFIEAMSQQLAKYEESKEDTKT